MVRVKICGITNIDDALTAQEAGADIVGFVFAESPRRMQVEAARDIIASLSPKVETAVLFVNEKKDVVDGVVRALGRVDILQFHGDETPAYCEQFEGKGIIKAFRIKDGSCVEAMADFKGIADFALLDAYAESIYGGTGKAFNWDLAVKAKAHGMPIILSGGLNPDNIKEAIAKVRPYGVDVSSGVEKCPGIKDPELMKRFLAAARSA